jgi:hypothetical protein
MRRIITTIVAVLTLACVLVEPATAQLFRGGAGRPNVPRHPAFGGPFNHGFVNSVPTMTRSSSGTFNPATGAFRPNSTGPYMLSRHNGFEPVRGQFTADPKGNFSLSVRERFNPNTGTFVPSTTGNIVLRERGDFTPSTGAFAKTMTGSVNVRNGNFVPNATGASTIMSGGLFVPGRGVFVQSPGGNFTLVTKEAFDPSRHAFVPSANGTFSFSVRGEFLPGVTPSQLTNSRTAVALGNTGFFSPRVNTPSARSVARTIARDERLLTSLGLNPFFNNASTNPFLAQAMNPYASWVNPYFNPYLNTGYNPYTAGYGSSGYGSSGYSAPYMSYGGSSYASPTAGASNAPANNIPAYTPTSTKTKPSVLAAYGIPTENDHVAWPLAFRLMSPDQKRDVLEPLESELLVAATQAVGDRANPSVLWQAKQSVEEARTWLLGHRNDMAAGTYRDGDRFLGTIERALKTMGAAN